MFEITGGIPEPIFDEPQEAESLGRTWQALIGSQTLRRRSSTRYEKGTGDPPKRHRRGNFQKPGSKFRSGFFRVIEESRFENPLTGLIVRSDVRTLLALEDGRYFEGESFGATGTRVGEVCFNTAMTGYQEVLTDPSYRGQIVAMTYPLIGNYGINSLDQESRSHHVLGSVVEELTEIPSNWRSEMSLDEYLQKWNIPGAQGIDTRALTRHLRTRGAMKACLTTEAISPEEATQRAIEGEGVIGMDYVREVSTPKIYQWDPNGKLSTPWSITAENGGAQIAHPPIQIGRAHV